MSHDSAKVVLKVGGSLYDWPDLADALRRFIDHLRPKTAILVGSGPFADMVQRSIASTARRAAHWLALQSLSSPPSSSRRFCLM